MEYAYIRQDLDSISAYLNHTIRSICAYIHVWRYTRWIPFFGRTCCNALVNADLLELEPPDPLTVDGVFPILNENKKNGYTEVKENVKSEKVCNDTLV